MHAEATSEKMALGHYLDGRVSLVVGTHTHVPTADCQILSKGTGYMTDLGMCGDYNSVIGMEIEEPISRFTTGVNRSRFMPAADTATLCGIFVEFDKCKWRWCACVYCCAAAFIVFFDFYCLRRNVPRRFREMPGEICLG